MTWLLWPSSSIANLFVQSRSIHVWYIISVQCCLCSFKIIQWCYYVSPVLSLFLQDNPVLLLFLHVSPVPSLFVQDNPVLLLFLHRVSPVLSLFLQDNSVLLIFLHSVQCCCRSFKIIIQCCYCSFIMSVQCCCHSFKIIQCCFCSFIINRWCLCSFSVIQLCLCSPHLLNTTSAIFMCLWSPMLEEKTFWLTLRMWTGFWSKLPLPLWLVTTFLHGSTSTSSGLLMPQSTATMTFWTGSSTSEMFMCFPWILVMDGVCWTKTTIPVILAKINFWYYSMSTALT